MEFGFFVLVLLVFGVVGFLFWWFSAEQVAKRKLKKAEAVSIARAQEGSLIKIAGTLCLEAASLDGPLSGRACAGYLVEVKEKRRSGKNSHWRTVIREQEMVSFLVEDETGRALVKAGGATLVLVRDSHESSGFLNDAPGHVEAFLQRHGRSSEGFLGMNKTMRYTEGVLEPGEEVAVLGVARWELDPDPTRTDGYRGRGKRLVVDMSDDGTMIVSDDPSTLG